MTYVAFFALVVVGTSAFDLWQRCVRQLGVRRKAVEGVALVGVLVLGLADQSSAYVVDYSASAGRYRSDQEFYNRIEDTVPACASIFNVPYNTAPEGLTNAGRPFHQLVGTLFTDCMSFSYGAPRGRVGAEWQANAVALPATLAFNAILSVGYAGFLVERQDFTDGGSGVAAFLGDALDVEPMVSNRRDLFYFDAQLAYKRFVETFGGNLADQMRSAVLEPVLVRFGEGFNEDGYHARVRLRGAGLVHLENYSGTEREIVLLFDRPTFGGVRGLRVVGDDGETIVELDSAVTDPWTEARVVVPPGGTTLTFVPVDPTGDSSEVLLGLATYDVVLEPLRTFGPVQSTAPFTTLSSR